MNLSKEEVSRMQRTMVATRNEINKVIVGMEQRITDILVAILSNGHCLLEGVPGLGKTLLVQTLAKVLDLKYARIQFTPDLMPADITGTNILLENSDGTRVFHFLPGPVFANIVLADEINRTTAKTQSALLEAMQESSVTVAGRTHILEQPFFVLATQNPLELEGTYPLPEAQLDRFFFKLTVDYPSLPELLQIMELTTGANLPEAQVILQKDELLKYQNLVRLVPISSDIMDYAARLVLATNPNSPQSTPAIKRYIKYGSSPRGAQALVLAAKARAFLDGRVNVSFNDVQDSLLPALRHRLILNFEGEAANIDVDKVLKELLERIPPIN
ncbi:MAG: MoxR family ATPase [Firmicutes bacterium]|nr:MoxR family ATPase [Bacillota bacterium]